MDFKEAVKTVGDVLTKIGSHIDSDKYDGLIVKKLESSNTLDEGRTTKQYHIAITGAQMDFFPYIRADGYFNPDYSEEDNNLKKYFVVQIPVCIHNENVKYLTDSTETLDADEKMVNVSIVRSRRKDATDQIQMSMTYLDSPEFVEFRHMVHTGSYLVMLKFTNTLEYDMFAVKGSDIDVNGTSLADLNNAFFMLPTNTAVPLSEVIQDSVKSYSADMECGFNYRSGLKTEYNLNHIIFGAPGTGKSHKLEEDKKQLLKDGGEYERVTFHPDYTYSQFVGTYKPVSEGRDIYYKFVPGPFIRVFVNAVKSIKAGAPRPYLLLIEEINRAPVAAVFGDVFQLLDRDDDGTSQYEIETSEDLRTYLAEALGDSPEKFEKIKIPDNMYIWATMNSADQGVYPMDTAFKRRWEFTYLGVDDNDKEICDKYVVVGNPEKEQQRIEWNSLRKAINEWLASKKVNEDKQLGPYFISRSIVVPADGGSEINSDDFSETFQNKVLMYLFEDAARQHRSELFKGAVGDDGKQVSANRYSEICRAFRNQGIGIFNEEIQANTKPEDLFINGHKVDHDGVSEQ